MANNYVNLRYRDAAKCSCIAMDHAASVEWAKKELQSQVTLVGEDGVDSKWVARLAQKTPEGFKKQILDLLPN